MPLYDSEGKVFAAIESIRDITDRKLAEEALAAEKERLSVTLRSIGDGVITISAENAEVTAAHNLPLLPGRYIKISIKDTGEVE